MKTKGVWKGSFLVFALLCCVFMLAACTLSGVRVPSIGTADYEAHLLPNARNLPDVEVAAGKLEQLKTGRLSLVCESTSTAQFILGGFINRMKADLGNVVNIPTVESSPTGGQITPETMRTVTSLYHADTINSLVIYCPPAESTTRGITVAINGTTLGPFDMLYGDGGKVAGPMVIYALSGYSRARREFMYVNLANMQEGNLEGVKGVIILTDLKKYITTEKVNVVAEINQVQAKYYITEAGAGRGWFVSAPDQPMGGSPAARIGALTVR